MQLTAKLFQILPAETGTGRNGEWKKQSIIVETEGQYPKKVCITVWGDKINAAQLHTGQNLMIDFDIESREFNGRWYTDVKAWKVEPVAGAVAAEMPLPSVPSAASDFRFPEPPPEPQSDFNDLPF
ncbi:MAG: DUF3127 domain-containing protein [Dysgonamonadaceae bacterium]|jgi:hypothetical protein|nr:DUF3127 domain-containing protein [Dysgonamonadaceae bacterium]